MPLGEDFVGSRAVGEHWGGNVRLSLTHPLHRISRDGQETNGSAPINARRIRSLCVL
jgi:hypothetical protein